MRLTVLAGLCAVLLGFLCLTSNSHAQGCSPADLSCDTNAGQGSTSALETQLKQFQTALARKPTSSGKADDKLFYDLVIDNLCDTGGIVEAVKTYVASRSRGLFVNESRAAALTLTISFAGTDNPKKVVFPVVALSDDVDPKADPKTEIN